MTAFPPNVSYTESSATPNYEGRAMAFIMFTLKLLFGLNDVTEAKMSKSATRLNRKLEELGRYKSVFVFSEWARYLEMRKVILGQVHHPINKLVSKEAGVEVDIDLMLDYRAKLLSQENCVGELGTNRKYRTQEKGRYVDNLKNVVGKIVESKELSQGTKQSIQFEPSLTPYRSYLSTFLLAYNKDGAVHVPNFMHEDHTERTVIPFVEPTHLKEQLLRNHQLKLTTKKVKSARDVFRFVDLAKLNEFVTNCELYEAPYMYLEEVKESKWKPPKIEPKPTLSHEAILEQIIIRNEVQQQKTNLILDSREPTDPSESTSFFSESLFSTNLSSDNPSVNLQPPSQLSLLSPNYEYWVRFYHTQLEAQSLTQFEERIAPELPASFQLVLNECARVIENWPATLYLELMTLERYFFQAVQPVERFFRGEQGAEGMQVEFEDIGEVTARWKAENAVRDY